MWGQVNVIKLSAAGRVAQRIKTKALACAQSKSLKSRSLGLDMALRAYSTGARFLNLTLGGRLPYPRDEQVDSKTST
jgi:hypothetical protein